MSKGLNYIAKARPEAATGLLTFYKKQCYALDDKTRFLISVVTKVANGSDRGLKQYAPKAIQAGASKQEVLDAVLMAFPVCGLTRIIDSIHVLVEVGLLPEDPDDLQLTEEALTARSQAAPEQVKLCQVDELETGKCKSITNSEVNVLIYKESEDKINVFEAVCPHADGQLADDDAQGAVITCPLHDWKFNLRNGENIEPSDAGLNAYESFVEDGALYAFI